MALHTQVVARVLGDTPAHLVKCCDHGFDLPAVCAPMGDSRYPARVGDRYFVLTMD
jgi:hypothetical protein